MTPPSRPFTAREREVAALIAEGHGYATMAKYLGVSPRTIEGHVLAMAAKLPEDGRKPLRRIMLWMNHQQGAA